MFLFNLFLIFVFLLLDGIFAENLLFFHSGLYIKIDFILIFLSLLFHRLIFFED